MSDTVKPHRMTFLNRLYARLRELLAERGGLTDRDFRDAVKSARGHTGGKAKAEAMAALLAAEGDPTGVAVVLPLPQELAQALALAGGLPAEDLHLTIGMIGRRDEMTDVQLAEALLAVRDAGICCAPITATIGGIGRFMASNGSDAKDVVYLSVDSPALLELRDEVEDALEARGLELQTDHGFTPHITLAYIDPGAAMPLDSIEPQSVTFAVLALWAGPQRSVVALIGPAEQDEGMVEAGAALGIKDFADIAKHKDELEGKIYGIEPGNDGNRLVLDMITAGKFDLGGFEVVESSEQGMLAAVAKGEKENTPVVFLGWEPHPMNANFKMSYLTGGDDVFGPNFGGAEVNTNVRKGYVAECPNTGKLLQNLEFSLAMENEIMGKILNDGQDAEAAATEWLKANPTAIDPWLAGVTTKDGGDAVAAVKAAIGL